MAAPSEKLAESLEILKALQDGGLTAIRATDLSRTHRERLLENGFIQEVMKGWYVQANPKEQPGSSTAWYASFWGFCADYLNARFGNDWTLSPEQSLLIHSGRWTVPNQLLVRSPNGKNNTTNLPHGTSVFDLKLQVPPKEERDTKEGLGLYALPASLVEIPEAFFKSNATDVRTALLLVKDASDVLGKLLEGSHTVIAGRLAGAFRNVGMDRVADDIMKTMQSAGYDVRESDPFDNKVTATFTGRETSPYVHRIKVMWHDMREAIIALFPPAPGFPAKNEQAAFLKKIQDVYVTDAYHSLSIEGYRVTPELIETVRLGAWNPEENQQDREHRNALAARGYWLSYQAVLKSIERILNEENPGTVADEDHGAWYRELFAPSVTVGLLKARDLAGYRNGPVYIKNSMHVPLNRDAVRDAMPALFDLLKEEPHAGVRAVLGHFIYVYIHPYSDGNGRTGRFLMNAMLASGGYPWTVVPVTARQDYMTALEQASVTGNMVPFAELLAGMVSEGLEGKPLPAIPA
ncbi:MAG: cell filamentation protein Fic [Azospira oryzae]|jgi:hypothetical protein|nr:MAG: cell filamentation protein Fic [Azospira oryzae]